MPRQKSLSRTFLEPIAAALVLAALVRSLVHVYSIPSASMAPSLRVGDHILVTRYLGGSPRRGDVIVFHSPRDSSELMVKRVIGVAGDLIDSRLGRVRIGGYTLPEPWVHRAATTGAIEAQVIPAGTYYVLGDNREESIDSRSWGPIPATSVVGRARMVLWSSGLGTRQAQASAPSDAAGSAPAGAGRRLFKWIE
jgi:signal peptidase I